jgi:hypothetical protein
MSSQCHEPERYVRTNAARDDREDWINSGYASLGGRAAMNPFGRLPLTPRRIGASRIVARSGVAVRLRGPVGVRPVAGAKPCLGTAVSWWRSRPRFVRRADRVGNRVMHWRRIDRRL